MSLLRMVWFHTRRFWAVPFFVQLLLISTTQVVCLQALAHHAGSAAGTQGWIRAALVGMWMVSTVSAGIVGFQRFQGTLVHLVRSPRPTWQSTGPVVAAVAALGLFCIPVALLLAIALGMPVAGSIDGRAVGGLILFWLATIVMASLIATLFVLSRYATTYEGLIGAPLVLLSDIFGHPADWSWFDMASAWLPTAWATKMIFDPELSMAGFTLGYATSSVVWAVGVAILGRRALRRATRLGTLEVV
ncbi:MAG: hypothetical protein CSA84_03350 [Actinomycetales bacterium]|nr:MAG: hypothetical protein CSA84_03350 [Actinomycetales bacterium]